ncbi:HCNGP-like protein-domain-containing protein [Chytriomyces sp. MP71]|nr:HCNGP-like protein-domain-containing protein [Chytriomyces sp. MP71]
MNFDQYGSSDSEDGSPPRPQPPQPQPPRQLQQQPPLKPGSRPPSRTSTPLLNVVSNTATRTPSPLHHKNTPPAPLPHAGVAPSALATTSNPPNLNRDTNLDENESALGMNKGADTAIAESVADSDNLLSLLRPVRAPDACPLTLPPLPTGDCDPQLQAKVEKWTHLRNTSGRRFNETLTRTQSFANPAIMSKLIEFLGLQEHGSNLDARIFDPKGFPPAMYYDEIAKAQKAASERPPFAVAVNPSTGQASVVGAVQFTSGDAPNLSAPGANVSKVSSLQPQKSTNSGSTVSAIASGVLGGGGSGGKRRWDQGGSDLTTDRKKRI